MWSGKYKFGSYKFSVTPTLHEAGAEFLVFSKICLLYKVVVQKIKYTLH